MSGSCFLRYLFIIFQVFDSNEDSGYLVLTIVISGHFFISQGKTLLVGLLHVVYENIFLNFGA